MNCPDCGSPVEKDAKFCPKCHARIESPGLLRRMMDFFKNLARPDVRVIRANKPAPFGTPDLRVQGTVQLSSDQPPAAPPAQFVSGAMHILKSHKRVTIAMVDKDGNRHEYHSLEEVPLAMRSEFEKLAADVMHEPGSMQAAEMPAQAASQPGIIRKSSVASYTVKDASGQEHTYHSLDELPPKIREALKRLRLPPGATP
jgi:hypothetical protein